MARLLFEARIPDQLVEHLERGECYKAYSSLSLFSNFKLGHYPVFKKVARFPPMWDYRSPPIPALTAIPCGIGRIILSPHRLQKIILLMRLRSLSASSSGGEIRPHEIVM